jgi:hypothetical protein
LVSIHHPLTGYISFARVLRREDIAWAYPSPII